MKKILLFLINPQFLIPAICISVLVYFSGAIDVFKKYENHEVNVCIRSLDLKEVKLSGIKTDDGIFRWFEICGLFMNNIQNNNKPGVISNGQIDVSANRTTFIKCLVKGSASYSEMKLEKIAHYNGKCKIENIDKWNNGEEIYKINKGLNKPLLSK